MRVAMYTSLGNYIFTYDGAKSMFLQRTRLRSTYLGSHPAILKPSLALTREEASSDSRRP